MIGPALGQEGAFGEEATDDGHGRRD
jgi:hypothetical protein